MCVTLTRSPCSAWNRLPSTSWRWLVSPACLVAPEWRPEGKNPQLPQVLAWLASPKHLAWSASLLQLLFPRTTAILLSTGVYVCTYGKVLTLLSSCSPPGLPQTPEGTYTRVSPSPLRISRVPDPCCCVNCLPIDPVWQTLLSLQGVTQVPIFSWSVLWNPPSWDFIEHEDW